MAERKIVKEPSQILYSCYVNKSREGEQFVPEHSFTYQISGTLTFNDGNKEFVFKKGDFRFIKRNHLVKFLKQPEERANSDLFRFILTRIRFVSLVSNTVTNPTSDMRVMPSYN